LTGNAEVEDLLRRLGPQVLGLLVRRYGGFDVCEDAVQEALLAAAVQWPKQGIPENPRGWLITVASRRVADELRSDHARRRREEAAAAQMPPHELVASAPGDEQLPEEDDTLTLFFLCAHPALSPASQVALTLRAVGGLSTAEIARAFLVPEATIAQRISRGKQRIKASGIPFGLPAEPERAERLRVVLQVLYLIFNEGYTASSGRDLQRGDLTAEAIRLTRQLRRLLPKDGEVAGLLALMLLTEARRAARTRPDGTLVPLTEQDRSRWNQELIQEGLALVTDALSQTALGPTSSRRRSPQSTPKPLAQRTPTGRRSSPSTSFWKGSRRPDDHTQPRRRGRDGARPSGGTRATRNTRRREDRGAPPPARDPRAPPRNDRRPPWCPAQLSDRRPPDPQSPRAALPRGPRRPP
jgi:RNA polymerase sigma factor (sigma-70 family)